MFRFKLRALLIVLALGPLVLAAAWWFFNSEAMAVLEREAPYVADSLAEGLWNLTILCILVVAAAYIAARVATGVTKQ
jgi:hypothetical protein